MTQKKHQFEHDLKLDVEARVRQGVKAVLEEVLEEEMTEHLKAGYRELTPTRRGERNGYYQRNLVTPAGKIERLEVPRDREGEFVTEVFERYKRMTGDVEEAVLEMYLSGISVRKIAGVTDALSKVRIGKDAVSRIASRLREEQREWRERSLEEKSYPYLYLDATYLKVRWGARVTSMVAWRSWLALGWMRRASGRSWRWKWPARRRERPTPRCFEGSSTGAFQECAW